MFRELSHLGPRLERKADHTLAEYYVSNGKKLFRNDTAVVS